MVGIADPLGWLSLAAFSASKNFGACLLRIETDQNLVENENDSCLKMMSILGLLLVFQITLEPVVFLVIFF